MKSFIMQEIDVGFSGRDETQVDPEKQVDPSSVPLERMLCLHDAGERPL